MLSAVSSHGLVSSLNICQCKMLSLYILYIYLFNKFYFSSCFTVQEEDYYSTGITRKEHKNREVRKCVFSPPPPFLQRSELQNFQEVLLAGFLFEVYTMLLVLNPMMLTRTGESILVFESLSLKAHAKINTTKNAQTMRLLRFPGSHSSRIKTKAQFCSCS